MSIRHSRLWKEMRLALVFWGLGESWASDAGVARLMVRWVDLGVLDPAGGP